MESPPQQIDTKQRVIEQKKTFTPVQTPPGRPSTVREREMSHTAPIRTAPKQVKFEKKEVKKTSPVHKEHEKKEQAAEQKKVFLRGEQNN